MRSVYRTEKKAPLKAELFIIGRKNGFNSIEV